MKCPHCHEPFDLCAIEDDDAGLAMVLKPNAGQMLDAKTLGGVLTDTAKLFAACGKDVRVRVKTCIKSISTDDNGAIHVRFQIAKSRYKKDSESRVARP